MSFDLTITIAAAVAIVVALISVGVNWGMLKASEKRQDDRLDHMDRALLALDARQRATEQVLPRLEERIAQVQGSTARIEDAVMTLLRK